MYQLDRIKSFLLLLTMLFLVGNQRVQADEDQPFFYIPSAEFSDYGQNGFSYSSPTNPYFTLYLWYLNDDQKDSHWTSDPVLTIDGEYTVKIPKLKDHYDDIKTNFYTPFEILTCEKDGKVVCWVRYKGQFKVYDSYKNTKFSQTFPLCDLQYNKNAINDDYYIELEIIFADNVEGKNHSVTCRGTARTDLGTKEYDCIDPSDDLINYLRTGSKTVCSGSTYTPFGVFDYGNSSLLWTDVKTLTFTSPKFNEKRKLGYYQLAIDGELSQRKGSDTIIVTKKYDTPVSYGADSLPLHYMFYDIYNFKDKEQRLNNYSETLTYNYNSMGSNLMVYEHDNETYSMNFNSSFYIDDNRTAVRITGPKLDYAGSVIGGELKIASLDFKQLTKAKVVSTAGSYEWTGSASSCSLNIGAGRIQSIELTFDRAANGWGIVFREDTKKAPKKMARIENLELSEANPWSNILGLQWHFKDVLQKGIADDLHNYDGTFLIYRDNIKIATKESSSDTIQYYQDKLAPEDMGKMHHYTVSFQPKGWTSTDADSLTIKGDFSLDYSLDIDSISVNVNGDKDGYNLSWRINTDLKNDGSNYYFKIYRIASTKANPTAADFQEGACIDSVKVIDRTNHIFSYTDKAVNSTNTYAYLVSIDAQKTTFYSDVAMSSDHPDGTRIKNMTATRGTETGQIVVSWNAIVNANDYMDYSLYRHKITPDDHRITTIEEASNPSLWSAIDLDANTYSNTINGTFKYIDHVDDGNYYAYAVVARAHGSDSIKCRALCDGFARSTATVSGKVTYPGSSSKTEYAVEGAKVAVQAADSIGRSMFNSLYFDGGGKVKWAAGKTKMDNYFRNNHAFSTQMYVKPAYNQSGMCLLDIDSTLCLSLGAPDAGTGRYPIVATVGGQTYTSSLQISPAHFSSLTFTYDGSGKGMLYVATPDVEAGSVKKEQLLDGVSISWLPGTSSQVILGSKANDTNRFNGYVDDVRFFKRELTQADIEKNYNHMLGGKESGLVAYWSFDEGLKTIRHAYDYSFDDNGIANDNYATILGVQRTNNAIPTADQLALFAYTDTLGAYNIQGIPFTGDYTLYNVIPSKGVHQFAYQGDKNKPTTSISVSSKSLSFPGTDFVDVSSFNVRGSVFYENTTYPVDSCYFMVDDVVIKDANNHLITSNAEGEFCIPVSAGEHRIRIMKKDHTFLHDGYYPASGYFNFNDSISNLTFTDQTKAVVVGRIVGGAIEKTKQLGFGESTANIGAATLTLVTNNSIADARRMNVYIDEKTGVFQSSTDTLHYELANPDYVQSKAYTAGYVEGVNNSDVVRKIVIHTDPRSGEFAVKLPPVRYYISTVVDHNEEATGGLLSNVLLDASNVSVGDTAKFDNKTLVYNTAFVQEYTSAPLISVKQIDNEDGAFGAAHSVVTNADGTTKQLDVYTVQNDGKVKYNYGYPIFEFAGRYTFDISSYERYVNYDGAQPVEYKVPSAGTVHISNLISSPADTAKVGVLDSLGHYMYTFQAMNPNIQSPYTRPLSIAVDINGYYNQWYWDEANDMPLEGIPFGAVLTGNSFVTKAPDQITNILRDPFGNTSSLTWSKGTTHSTSWDCVNSLNFGINFETFVSKGIDANYSIGVPMGGPYKTYDNKGQLTKDANYEFSLDINTDFTRTWTSTTTQSVSTSSDPSYDGPDGDVYIGISNSLLFGDGKNVQFVNDQEGGWKVAAQDAIVTGDSIESTFMYSQFFIETQLIPGFEKDRNALFQLVDEATMQSMIQSHKNNDDKPLYITARKPGDPNFGANNDSVYCNSSNRCFYGSSYAVFYPMSKEIDEDKVSEYNMQIQAWKDHIADNEHNKLIARNNETKYFKENVAFDNAPKGSYSYSESFNLDESVSAENGHKFYKKYIFNGKVTKASTASERTIATDVSFKYSRHPIVKRSDESTETYTVDFSDNADFNSHNINVYSAPDDFSPIFVQLGGQTSEYYEDAQYARYYMPEKKLCISDKTVQIEVPHIQCDKPVVTGVPTNGFAEYKLKLTNATSALGITWPIKYTLAIANDKWAQMASVTSNSHDMVNGKFEISLTNDTTASDSALVMLRVGRASSNVFNIDSLHVKFYPVGEPAIHDDIYLSAHFVPDAEAINLKSTRTLVNTATDSTLVLSASGYDINNALLSAVRLEQSRGNDSEWTTVRNYVRNPMGSTESPLTESVDTLINMRDKIAYPDDVYYFRAVTVCPVGDEVVEAHSEVIKVVKDVTLPDVMETPSPSDGVLNVGDNIGVEFNEDILSKSLNKVDNFIVQSVLNTDSVAHDVALLLSGSETPAATSQSTLTLGGTSFTLCGWIKSGNTAGTIYRHGEGEKAFRLDIDADGYLTAYITDSLGQALPYTSSAPIKKDTWTYLGVVYNVKTGMLNIYSAYGSEEKQLMNEVYVGKSANASGNIYLGKGVTGAMHELTLFSENRTWDTIKSQMYLGKNHSTPALIGYWRLDEGYGTKSKDLARSRHMQLSSANNWYFENQNISLALDGTHYPGVSMGTISAASGVSYLLEMWALADTDNANEEFQLFSLDKGQRLDAVVKNGKLMMVADSTYYDTNTTLTDHQWHHIALNVLNGQSGLASLLVDGTSVWSATNDKLPDMAGGTLWFGRNMKGMLDEIRLWHSTNTRETINDRMYYRLDGQSEYGLVGYWPMEESKYNEYNQREFNFSLKNMAKNATDATTLVPDAEGVTLSAGTSAPGLKVAPNKSNLLFDFTADERKVNVTLKQGARSIEGCTVFTTLRDYYDTNSNVGHPVSWSFVVKQNPLSWNVGEMTVKADAGSDTTFVATLNNNSTGDQDWFFKDLPDWLEASPSSGTVFAHGSTDVTFTVKGINPIGKYFASVSARTKNDDENSQLDTPLDICLTVAGQRPDWEYNKSFDQSMIVTGQIKINGIISTDPDDMVGAFTGASGDMLGECMGVGHPTYNANKDAYYVSLMVYGTKAMKNDTVRFRLYDASTGHVYPLTEVSKPVTFIPDGDFGTTGEPVIWSNMDKLLQTISLVPGCNWISLYLNPINPEITQLFSPIANQIDSIEVAPDVSFRYREGRWNGVATIKPGQMIKVTMNDAAVLPVIGDAVKPGDYPVTIAPNGSTWVGVPSSTYMTIDEAFANISPVEGDKVKSQNQVTTYEDGKWLADDGALLAIEPSKGYIYTSHDDEEKQLVFPDENPQHMGVMRFGSYLSIPAHYRYPDNMILICTVRNQDDELVWPEAIKVYSASGELRGMAKKIIRDSLLVLAVSGQREGETLLVKADVGATSLGIQPVTAINFKKNHYLGTLRRPLVISAMATDISETKFDADSRLAVYNLSGRQIYSGRYADFDCCSLTLNAIYIFREIKTDGTVNTRKIRIDR